MGFSEAEDQFGEGFGVEALIADDGDQLPGMHVDGDILEEFSAFAIFERYIFEEHSFLDRAAGGNPILLAFQFGLGEHVQKRLGSLLAFALNGPSLFDALDGESGGHETAD